MSSTGSGGIINHKGPGKAYWIWLNNHMAMDKMPNRPSMNQTASTSKPVLSESERELS